MKPYHHNNNTRTFSKDVNPLDLIWHQDEYDRIVEVISGEGWQFQRDNTLPLEMSKGKRIFIPKHQIHRVIKGTTDLVIKITELKKSGLRNIIKEELNKVLNEETINYVHSEETIERFKPIIELAEKYPQLYISKTDLNIPDKDSISFSVKLQPNSYQPDRIEGDFFINPYLPGKKKWAINYRKTNPSGRSGGTYRTTDDDKWVYNYIKKAIKKAIQNGVK